MLCASIASTHVTMVMKTQPLIQIRGTLVNWYPTWVPVVMSYHHGNLTAGSHSYTMFSEIICRRIYCLYLWESYYRFVSFLKSSLGKNRQMKRYSNPLKLFFVSKCFNFHTIFTKFVMHSLLLKKTNSFYLHQTYYKHKVESVVTNLSYYRYLFKD